MSNYAPEALAFVEGFVFNNLESLRKTREMEERYRPLEAAVKSRSTKEIKRIAAKLTGRLVDGDFDLANITSEQIRDVFMNIIEEEELQGDA